MGKDQEEEMSIRVWTNVMRPEWKQLRCFPKSSDQELIKMLHPSSRLPDQYQERKVRLDHVYKKMKHFNMSLPSWADNEQEIEPMDEYAFDKEIHELEQMKQYYQKKQPWW